MTIKNFMNIVDGKVHLNESTTMECGEMPPASPAPVQQQLSMNLNFNAQGIQGIKDVLNLLSKVDNSEPTSAIAIGTDDEEDDVPSVSGSPAPGKEIVYGDEDMELPPEFDEFAGDVEEGILDVAKTVGRGLGHVGKAAAHLGKHAVKGATKAAGYAAGYGMGGPVGAGQGTNLGKSMADVAFASSDARLPDRDNSSVNSKKYARLEQTEEEFDYDGNDDHIFPDGGISGPGGINKRKKQYRKEYPGDNIINSIHTENVDTIRSKLFQDYKRYISE